MWEHVPLVVLDTNTKNIHHTDFLLIDGSSIDEDVFTCSYSVLMNFACSCFACYMLLRSIKTCLLCASTCLFLPTLPLFICLGNDIRSFSIYCHHLCQIPLFVVGLQLYTVHMYTFCVPVIRYISCLSKFKHWQ
jgi:hypothetical protein